MVRGGWVEAEICFTRTNQRGRVKQSKKVLGNPLTSGWLPWYVSAIETTQFIESCPIDWRVSERRLEEGKIGSIVLRKGTGEWNGTHRLCFLLCL